VISRFHPASPATPARFISRLYGACPIRSAVVSLGSLRRASTTPGSLFRATQIVIRVVASLES